MWGCRPSLRSDGRPWAVAEVELRDICPKRPGHQLLERVAQSTSLYVPEIGRSPQSYCLLWGIWPGDSLPSQMTEGVGFFTSAYQASLPFTSWIFIQSFSGHLVACHFKCLCWSILPSGGRRRGKNTNRKGVEKKLPYRTKASSVWLSPLVRGGLRALCWVSEPRQSP